MSTSFDVKEISERDRKVVELVGQFKQLTPRHVRALAFAGVASQTPVDRALKRLVDRRYLMRLERRLVGGTRGGSAQYVHQLGRQGWKLLGRHGDYWAPRAVNLHSLALADCIVALKAAEQRGVPLELVRFTTEPECHETVGGVRLTPDAFVDLNLRSNKLVSWLEVDRGTEHLATIQEKCERYWKAFISGQWDGHFPFVLFVVPDEERERAIERVVRDGPSAALELFKVCPIEGFPRFA